MLRERIEERRPQRHQGPSVTHLRFVLTITLEEPADMWAVLAFSDAASSTLVLGATLTRAVAELVDATEGSPTGVRSVLRRRLCGFESRQF